MSMTAEYHREWRRRRKEKGLCPNCPRPAEPGHAYCAEHLRLHRQWSLARNRRRGQRPWRKGGRGRPPLATETQEQET